MNYPQLLSLFCCLVMSVIGYTQTDRPQPRFPKTIHHSLVQKEIEELSVRLALTEDQVKEVATIENRFYNAYVELQNTVDSGLDRKARLQQLKKDKEEALKKVFTTTQWQTYVTYVEERLKKVREEIEERRRGLQAANASTNKK